MKAADAVLVCALVNNLICGFRVNRFLLQTLIMFFVLPPSGRKSPMKSVPLVGQSLSTFLKNLLCL